MIVAESRHLRGVRSTPRMVKKKTKGTLLFAASFLLVATFLFLQISCIFRESRTFDEILHLKAGLAFWQEKDFTVEPFNPPLVREIISLPLLLDKTILTDPFLFRPRLVVVLFSLVLALIVYLWSNNLPNRYNDLNHCIKLSGVFSVLLLVFTPEILALGHYANTDLVATFLAVWSLFLFDKFFLIDGKPRLKHYVILGLAVGLSLAAKTTAIFFVLLPIAGWWLFFSKKENKPKAKSILIFVTMICLVIWSTYFFTLEPVFGYRADPNRQALTLIKKYPRTSFLLDVPVPLGSYLSTIKQNILSNQTNKFPRETVFWGKYSQGVPGIYVWLLFLIKTPIPILLLLLVSLFSKSRRRSKSERFIKLTIFLIFLQAVILGTNLRLRYFLILYPLVAIQVGWVCHDWWNKKQWWPKVVLGIIIVWLVGGTLKVYPHFLTFFNESVGGQNNGYKYAVDSNLDWGQGLPTLRKYLEERDIKDYQLAYFGNVDPSMFGLKYVRIKDANFRDSQEVFALDTQKPLVISASCWYYCGYYRNSELQRFKPKVLDGQFLLFNFSNSSTPGVE